MGAVWLSKATPAKLRCTSGLKEFIDCVETALLEGTQKILLPRARWSLGYALTKPSGVFSGFLIVIGSLGFFGVALWELQAEPTAGKTVTEFDEWVECQQEGQG